MNRTELSRALEKYSMDTNVPESRRNLAGLLEEALILLTLPETSTVLPLLPRIVAVALDGVATDNDPGIVKRREALERSTGRPFTNPARLAGVAEDALKMSRVIGEVLEQVTDRVVKAPEITVPLQAVWHLADSNAAAFFASYAYGELYSLPVAEATGSFGRVTLRFRREHDRTIVTFAVPEGELYFTSLGLGSGVLFAAHGDFTPDAITNMVAMVMSYWSPEYMIEL